MALGFLAQIGIQVAIFVGTSLARKLLTGGSSANSAFQTRGRDLQNFARTGAPVPVIYGQAQVPFHPVDLIVDTAITRNDDLDRYVPGYFCHGSRDGLGIASIDEIKLGDRVAINAAETILTPYDKGSGITASLQFVKLLGTLTQDFSTSNPVGGAALSVLPKPWAATDKGGGIAGMIFRFKPDEDVYPGGIPGVLGTLKGNFVEDTRSQVTPTTVAFSGTSITKVGGTSFVTLGYVAGDRVWPDGSATNDSGFTISVVAANVLTVLETTTTAGATGGITLARWAHPDNGGDNPALCARDYMLSTVYGGAASLSEFLEQNFKDDADICDELVNIPDGAGGTTTQKRFRCNGAIDTQRMIGQNVDEITSSCRGNVFREGGQYRHFITSGDTGSPRTADFSITRDLIVGGWTWLNAGHEDKINELQVSFKNADKGYAIDTASWPRVDNKIVSAIDIGFDSGTKVIDRASGSWIDDGYVQGDEAVVVGSTSNDGTYTVASVTALNLTVVEALVTEAATSGRTVTRQNPYLNADNFFENRMQVDLPMTTNVYMAEQLAMTRLKESRRGLMGQITCQEEALQLQIGDVVDVPDDVAWVSTKLFWVVAVSIIQSDDTSPDLVGVTLKEYEPGAYDLDGQSDALTEPDSGLPDPFNAEPITGLTLIAENGSGLISIHGANTINQITASWIAPEETNVRHYNVRYRYNGMETGLYVDLPPITSGTNAVITPIIPILTYEVGVQVVNRLGVTSDWVTQEIAPTPDPLVNTTTIDDGWSTTEDAGAPETGDVALTADDSNAYCNLEDAVRLPTVYRCNFHLDPGASVNTVRLFFYARQAGGTQWVRMVKSGFYLGSAAIYNQVSFTASLAPNSDLRAELVYTNPADDGLATATLLGEQHVRAAWGTIPGVQYDLPDYISDSSIIDDGWSSTQDASAPENGDVVISADGAVAYSHLEDSNNLVTNYSYYFDYTASGMTSTAKLRFEVGLKGRWLFVGESRDFGNETVTDEFVMVTTSMPGYNLLGSRNVRVTLVYDDATDDGNATVTMHGEDNSEPGVQYIRVDVVDVPNIIQVNIGQVEVLVDDRLVGAQPTLSFFGLREATAWGADAAAWVHEDNMYLIFDSDASGGGTDKLWIGHSGTTVGAATVIAEFSSLHLLLSDINLELSGGVGGKGGIDFVDGVSPTSLSGFGGQDVYVVLDSNDGGNGSTVNFSTHATVGYAAAAGHAGLSNDSAYIATHDTEDIAFLTQSVNLVGRVDGTTDAWFLLGNLTINAGSNTIAFPTGRGTNLYVLMTDGTGGTQWVANPAGVTDHGALTGLSDDDHSIYALVTGARDFTGDITATVNVDNSATFNDIIDAAATSYLNISNSNGTANSWAGIRFDRSNDMIAIQAIWNANNDVDLRFVKQNSGVGSGTEILLYDVSETTWDFQANDIVTTGDLLLGGKLVGDVTGMNFFFWGDLNGFAVSDYTNDAFDIVGTYTSAGTVYSSCYGFNAGVTIVARATQTNVLAANRLAGGITTQTATESVAHVDGVYVLIPNITDNLTGGGVITNATTLRIVGEPTEGVTNRALWVETGKSMLAATRIQMTGETAEAGLYVTGNFTSDGSWSGNFRIGCDSQLTGAAGNTAVLANAWFGGSIVTQTATEDIGYVVGCRIDEPNITDNLTGDITVAATLAVMGAPTEGLDNYALLVLSGLTQLGGSLLMSETSAVIGVNTDDASDNKRLVLAGADTGSSARGGAIWLHGNEYSSSPGTVDLAAGGSAGVRIYVGGTYSGAFLTGGGILELAAQSNIIKILGDSDGVTDDDLMVIAPSSSWGYGTGAYINLYGNEHGTSGREGILVLSAGNDAAGGDIEFNTGAGVTRLTVEYGGTVVAAGKIKSTLAGEAFLASETSAAIYYSATNTAGEFRAGVAADGKGFLGMYTTDGMELYIDSTLSMSWDNVGYLTMAAERLFQCALSTTTTAGFNLGNAGTAPTSPNDGDMWIESNVIKARLNGSTVSVDVT